MTRRERLEARLEKRLAWSASRAAKSTRAFDGARRIADQIPLGQPILVGHHSERRARRDQGRIHSGMSNGVEHQKMAREHASKADGIERALDESIFDDDPDAIEALEARIKEREAERDRMKTVNALYRKGDAAGLAALGLDLEALRAQVARVGLSWVKAPFEVTNLGASIRRDRERILAVKARRERAESAARSGGVAIEGDDWVRVTFAEKPERSVLDALKAAGFVWRGGSWCGERAKLPT